MRRLIDDEVNDWESDPQESDPGNAAYLRVCGPLRSNNLDRLYLISLR